MKDAHDEEGSPIEPHLRIFLKFLTSQRRPKNNSVFMHYIRDHYAQANVLNLYSDRCEGVTPGFTDVVDNLPGVMQ
jgi:hypothetical protein